MAGRMKLAWHVVCMGEKRNAYKFFVGIPEGKRPVGKHSRRWEDNINMYLIKQKIRDSSVGIGLCYELDDRDSRFRFPAGAGIFLFTTASRTARAHLASYPMGIRGFSPGNKAAGA
jgi:hypothetical protein